MTKVNISQPKAQFWTPLSSTGKFHKSVDEGTEGAIKRDYETSTGEKGSKWELQAESIEGYIATISAREGDFGMQVYVGFKTEDGETPVVIAMSAASSFAEDFMKKLPNINLDKEVKFAPYSFTDDKGKKRKGMTIYQDKIKIESYYSEKDADGKWKPTNGMPEVKKKKNGKEMTTEEWKIYFAECRVFLLEELEKHSLWNAAYAVEGEEEVAKEKEGEIDF